MKEIVQSETVASRVDPVAMYLEMMKLCLTDSIYLNDPLARYTFCTATTRWKRYFIAWVEKLLNHYKIRLVRPYAVSGVEDSSRIGTDELANIRRNGRDWPVRAHTMIGLKRLDNLQFCVETAIKDGIEGDLIETGIWRGGACIFMRAILKAYGDTGRTVWVADSFSGLPRPNPEDYPADEGDTHYANKDILGVSRKTVEENFRSYRLLDEQVRFLEGWFKDTLPIAPINRLAVMRLDGDMYESTIQALGALYPKLSRGGYVIIDDYFLSGCRRAVTDFRASNAIHDDIIDIDGIGVYWRRL